MDELGSRKYDLEERTLKFSFSIIELCKFIPKNNITSPLVNQLVRSASSIGANYREANGGSSRKDFTNKIFICKKEAKETLYWLELIGQAVEKTSNYKNFDILKKECGELVLIFSKIAASSKVV